MRPLSFDISTLLQQLAASVSVLDLLGIPLKVVGEYLRIAVAVEVRTA
jgi:hypothetical protein